MHDEAIRAAARAICQHKCFCGEVLGAPCIDPVTRMNGPCKANDTQLLLSWRQQAAKDAITAFLERVEVSIAMQHAAMEKSRMDGPIYSGVNALPPCSELAASEAMFAAMLAQLRREL